MRLPEWAEFGAIDFLVTLLLYPDLLQASSIKYPNHMNFLSFSCDRHMILRKVLQCRCHNARYFTSGYPDHANPDFFSYPRNIRNCIG